MASRHVSGDRSLLRDLKACAPITLVAANGSKVIVDQVGEVQLQVRAVNGLIAHIRVERVYFNKQFNNLLSWNRLSADGWALHSSMAESYVKTPSALGGVKLPLVFKGNVSMLVDAYETLHRVSMVAARAIGDRRVPQDFGQAQECLPRSPGRPARASPRQAPPEVPRRVGHSRRELPKAKPAAGGKFFHLH